MGLSGRQAELPNPRARNLAAGLSCPGSLCARARGWFAFLLGSVELTQAYPTFGGTAELDAAFNRALAPRARVPVKGRMPRAEPNVPDAVFLLQTILVAETHVCRQHRDAVP